MSGAAGDGEDRSWQRLDKWLWCARFLKARSDCARLVGGGLVRINRQPTDKAHARLRPGDVLTLPLRGDVMVVRVVSLAGRRGPAPEARLLYEAVPDAGEPAHADVLRPALNDCIPGTPTGPGSTRSTR